jgi:hypothetical protein
MLGRGADAVEVWWVGEGKYVWQDDVDGEWNGEGGGCDGMVVFYGL